MLPVIDQSEKMCWSARLFHRDKPSSLYLEDCKGSVNVKFNGTAYAEEEALGLLNYLCENSISHTYDDAVLAGSQA